MKQINVLLLIFGALSLDSCMSIAPVNTSFESARVLNRGELEFSGHFSDYYYKEAQYPSYPMNKNVGFRFGVGLNDKIELKLRYEAIIPDVYSFSESVDYYSLITKLQLRQGKSALLIPLSMYSFDGESNYFVISPGVVFTKRINQFIELNSTSKFDVFLNEELNIYYGQQLGIGFSSNLDNWALRPEVGLMKGIGSFDEGSFINWGIGLSIYLN